MTPGAAWQPTTILRYTESIASSSRTAIVQTDAGKAYLKATNNPEGPHVLACDWIGTHLARCFGLSTFDTAILEIDEIDEIPIDGTFASSGPAFVTRGEDGSTMGGGKGLKNVENITDLPRLVVFDTWVRNCDRYGPGYGSDDNPRINLDNLFLSTEGAPKGRFILKAFDHGHIFTCGRGLTPRLAQIDNVQDERVYGLFPFFLDHIRSNQLCQVAEELRSIGSDMWEDALQSIPPTWDVPEETRRAIDRFLLARARFLADNLSTMLPQVFSQGEFTFDANEGEES